MLPRMFTRCQLPGVWAGWGVPCCLGMGPPLLYTSLCELSCFLIAPSTVVKPDASSLI